MNRLNLATAVTTTAAVAIAAIVLAGCGASSPQSSDTTTLGEPTTASLDPSSGEISTDPIMDLSDITVKVGVVSSQGGASSRLALEASGIFDEASYRIEWVDFDGANAAVEAILAGAVDVLAPIQSPAVMLAEGNAVEPWTNETRPVRVVSAWEQTNNTGFEVAVRPDSGFTNIQDLDGARVAYPRGTTGHLLVLTLSEEFGLQFDEIVMPAAEGRAAFLSGAVDAVVDGYRGLSPLRASGEAVILARSPDYLETIRLMLVRNSFFEDPRADAVIADFNERYSAAEQWAEENIEVIAEIYIVEAGLERAEAAEISATQILSRRPFDTETMAILQNEANLLSRSGVVEREPNLAVIIDPSFDPGSG